MSHRSLSNQAGALVLALLSLLLLMTPPPALAATDHYHTEKTFPAVAGGTVAVDVTFHDVEITAYPGSEMDISVDMAVSASSERHVRELIAAYKPVFEEAAGTLRIRSAAETMVNIFGNHKLSGRIVIKMPPNINLSVKTVSGRIHLNGPVENARIQSASGDVDLKDPAGAVVIETISGKVKARWDSVSTNTRAVATSVSGDLRFAFPKETELTGTINTTSGRIRSDFPGVISGRGSNFALEGGPEAIQVSMKTVSGSIELIAGGRASSFPSEEVIIPDSSGPGVSVEFFKEDPAPTFFLNLYSFDGVFAPGLKYRIGNNFYATGNLEYSYSQRDTSLQIGGIYLIPHDVLFFRFYGGGGAEFSTKRGYRYPYLLMGTDFLIFFSEILYPWEPEAAPRVRSGISIEF